MNLIIGTAGHIDHGKTALVRALTGVDADRLPEEKKRGITIDLGFAELRLGDLEIGFVDVPGHERFVRNMLAGAGGIDVVLMVVAADEGVMPQTREHFEICRLLGTRAGIVVLTKSDLVDAEMLELVKLDTAELTENSFLQDAPTVAVSSKTGEGLDELKAVIEAVAKQIPPRPRSFVPRLPIDRRFSMKGFGAVVTGTLTGGGIAEGAELELLPSGKRVRVRGVQTQGRAVEKAAAGQRTALNLGGIDHSALARGMVLTEPGTVVPTQIIDTELEVVAGSARPVRSRQRVRFHLAAAEVLGRVHVLNEAGEILPGGRGFVQLRLESPVAALPGDRFIIRSYSPQATIAGGEVLDAHARRHRKRDFAATTDFLAGLVSTRQDPAERVVMFITTAGGNALSISELQSKTGYTAGVLEQLVAKLAETGRILSFNSRVIPSEAFEALKDRTAAFIKAEQSRDPLAGGVSREAVRERIFAFIDTAVFNKCIADLTVEGRITGNELLKAAGGSAALSGPQNQALECFRKIYRADNYEVPKLDEAVKDVSSAAGIGIAESRKVFQTMVASNEVVKVSSEFYFSREAVEKLTARLRVLAEELPDRLIDVPAFKQMAGLSRKFAIPILEYFDSTRVTVRHGEKRRVI